MRKTEFPFLDSLYNSRKNSTFVPLSLWMNDENENTQYGKTTTLWEVKQNIF